MPAAFLLHVDETRLFEDLEVVGNGLLACPTALSDCTDRQCVITYELEDLLALGSSERCEHIFGWHISIVPPC